MVTVLNSEKRGRRASVFASIAAAIVVAVAIFVLTNQATDISAEESSFVNDLLIGVFGADSQFYDPQEKLWLGLSVRRWAHVVEFWALGLFVSLASVLVRRGKSPVVSGAYAVGICAICSLTDQLHKLLVPGRHFDWLDLPLDALGYCVATAIVVIIVAVHASISSSRAKRRSTL